MWKQHKTFQPCTCPAVKIRTSSQAEGEACIFKNNFAEITYWISLHKELFQKSDHTPRMHISPSKRFIQLACSSLSFLWLRLWCIYLNNSIQNTRLHRVHSWFHWCFSSRGQIFSISSSPSLSSSVKNNGWLKACSLDSITIISFEVLAYPA